MFAVVNIAEGDAASLHTPVRVCADRLLRAVLVGDVHFRDQAVLLSLIFLHEAGIKAEASQLPAVAEKNRERVSLAKLVRDVVRLILEPRVIVIAAGCQILVPDLLAV